MITDHIGGSFEVSAQPEVDQFLLHGQFHHLVIAPSASYLFWAYLMKLELLSCSLTVIHECRVNFLINKKLN